MKARQWLYKIIQKIRIYVFDKLSDNTLPFKGICVQPTLFLGQGKIEIGINTSFGYYPSPFFFSTFCYIEARHDDACISIGNSNYFNNNLSIIADHGTITIGDRCLVGLNVSIMNSDFHPIRICDRHTDKYSCKDVKIGNDVFIGSNVTILKGVTIGDNAVIANGSVVYDDVKENTIVRGNPATFYKEIYE